MRRIAHCLPRIAAEAAPTDRRCSTASAVVNGLKLRQAAGVLMPGDIDAVSALLVP